MKPIKIIFIISFLIILTSNVYAFNFGTAINNGENFINTTTSTGNISAAVQLTTELSGAIMGIGVAIAIIVGLILAIKLMSDSAFEKADLKASLLPYFIGVIVIVGGWTIWKIVVSILQDI